MADEAEGKEVSKSSGGLLPIINLVLLVLVLAVGGFIAWKMMQMDQTAQPDTPETVQTQETTIPEAEAENPDAPPIYMEIEDITVNLADTDERTYLRAKIKLEVRNEEAQLKIESDMVKVMDLVITLLSSKRFDEISTPQGKYALKEDLTYRLNKLFGGGKPIKNLYFTDFVSQ
ncbi:MAG: flagellar basal body-associated FliL family protein [Mariprofundaceae bacterium]